MITKAMPRALPAFTRRARAAGPPPGAAARRRLEIRANTRRDTGTVRAGQLAAADIGSAAPGWGVGEGCEGAWPHGGRPSLTVVILKPGTKGWRFRATFHSLLLRCTGFERIRPLGVSLPDDQQQGQAHSPKEKLHTKLLCSFLRHHRLRVMRLAGTRCSCRTML